MDNLMSEHVNEILRIYDLKGSTHKRITTKPKNQRSVRKDLNFLRDTEFVLRVPPHVRNDMLRRM